MQAQHIEVPKEAFMGLRCALTHSTHAAPAAITLPEMHTQKCKASKNLPCINDFSARGYYDWKACQWLCYTPKAECLTCHSLNAFETAATSSVTSTLIHDRPDTEQEEHSPLSAGA